jgi:hypothetical protein
MDIENDSEHGVRKNSVGPGGNAVSLMASHGSARSLLRNAYLKFKYRENNGLRWETIALMVSSVASVSYFATGLASAWLYPSLHTSISDYILMFLLGNVLYLDAYIFGGTISTTPHLTLNSQWMMIGKSVVIIFGGAYFGYLFYDTSIRVLNILHNFMLVAMFVPSMILHEFEINELTSFFDAVDKQARFDINGKTSWCDDAKIFDCLMSKRAEFQRIAYVSSFSLLLDLLLSVSVCLVYTAFNLGVQNATTGPVEYVVHYAVVFAAAEGLIRRSSMYNDRISDLTNLIRFESPFLIKVLSFQPSGLLLLSFYISFFSLSIRLLFLN